MLRFARVITRLGGCLLLTGTTFATTNFLPDRDTPVASDQPIPYVDFGRPLLLENPVLNPAGTHFAALSKNEDLKDTLLVCEIATGKVEWSQGGVWRFNWISDRHVLLNYFGGNEYLRPPKRLNYGTWVAVEIGNLAKSIDVMSVLPRNNRGLQSATGFQWDLPADHLPRSDSTHVERYWTRPEDGTVAYCQTLSESGKRVLKRLAKGTWLDCPVDLQEITPIVIGEMPDEMIVLGPRAKGKPRGIQRMNVVAGTLGEIIYQDTQYDCQPRISVKRGTRQINGVYANNGTERTIWLSENMQRTQSLLNKQFPGALVQIVSTDIKESRFLIKVQSDRQPPVYYVHDRERKSLGLVKNVAPWIEPARMRPIQVIAYKARDEVLLEGYLTLPAGASKEHPAPLVVDIHAGPWQFRNVWNWNADTQFLASRGYAVFQPNYRGTIGYDSRIEPADRFAFEKMRDDVTDGVRMLVKSGLVDPNRIAVQGAGFGSYLALCGAMDEPTLYRCAILYGGIYDWELAFKRKNPETEWLRQQLQAHGQKPPAPLQHPEKIKIPIFFRRNIDVHDITHTDQIDEMHHALSGHVPCVNFGDLNIYEESDAHAENIRLLGKIDEFLAKYLTPR